MRNEDVQTTWEYHNATKHSPWSVRANAHYLDWPNQPRPFKDYPQLEPIPLPRVGLQADVPALEAVASAHVERQAEAVPDLATMATLLFYSAGVTKRKSHPMGQIYFRAAACAGALYPIEVYLVCGSLPGLEAGVYHFSPKDFALRRLRSGDHRGVLVRAAAGERSISSAPAVLVHTALTWRSSWKYQARSYRYHFWDDGMILANLLASAAGQELPAKVVMGFIDAEVNHLVGIDGEREMSLALIPLGCSSPAALSPPSEVPQLHLESTPLSKAEIDYPLIRDMHRASTFTTVDEVVTWREDILEMSSSPRDGKRFVLRPLKGEDLPAASLEAVVKRRASTRRFALKPISFEALSTLLERTTRGFPTDYLKSGKEHLNDLYLTVHAVEGLPSGAYFYHWQEQTIELLKEGNFRKESSFLCLEQPLGGDGAVTMFFMADLPQILRRYGNRGYRATQMEAGLIGGKLYLTAYALRMGATGLTFYDDDVTGFFSPHAQEKSAIFTMAFGLPGRRPST